MNASQQSAGLTPSQNWKLIVSYDGTDFSGWQIQPGRPTIQGELQAALGRVTGESPLAQGSGRTDAGVHALAQVASFSLQAPVPPSNLQRALNRTLPDAIRVVDTQIVAPSFHARHSAVAKTYEYRVFLERPGGSNNAGAPGLDFETREPSPSNNPGAPEPALSLPKGPSHLGTGESRFICPPFLARYVCSYPWPLDPTALNTAAHHFRGTHDFLSFAATDPDQAAREGKNPTLTDEDDVTLGAVRTIYSSAWVQRELEEGSLLVYRVRGNGFLHHMVRNLVGTMLDIGRGYRSAAEIPAMLAARARAAAGPTAPARGLFLHSVEYPE